MRWAALLLLLAACGGATPAPAAQVPRGVLVVHCLVPDALLVVDEQPIGEVRHLAAGVRLPAGAHRVELRHDRFHTRYAEVTLAGGATQTLELTLAEAYP